MTTSACSVIDLKSYREQRGTSLRAGSTGLLDTAVLQGGSGSALEAPAPDMSEALAVIGRELRNAELRLIDLAATLDELYAQVDDMSRR